MLRWNQVLSQRYKVWWWQSGSHTCRWPYTFSGCAPLPVCCRRALLNWPTDTRVWSCGTWCPSGKWSPSPLSMLAESRKPCLEGAGVRGRRWGCRRGDRGCTQTLRREKNPEAFHQYCQMFQERKVMSFYLFFLRVKRWPVNAHSEKIHPHHMSWWEKCWAGTGPALTCTCKRRVRVALQLPAGTHWFRPQSFN